MKPCRTCKFALPHDLDQNSGWCHRAPPTVVPGQALASTYAIVGMNNPGCGEHRFAWLRLLRRDQLKPGG